MTTKVRTGRDGAMGHDRSGNICLDEHAVRQGGVGRLVLFSGPGVQEGSINSQGAHRRSSGGNSGWRGSRCDASGRVGILIALSGDASEERASGGVVGIAVRTRRSATSGRLSRRGGTLRTGSSSTSGDFGMDEATPFAVGARSGDPESLGEDWTTATNEARIRRTLQISVLYLGCLGTFRSSSSP